MSDLVSPWQPMRWPIDLKHLGKLGEELSEAGAAAARCVIQGIEESEPVTGKPNRAWLEEEIADVFAISNLAIAHFGLDRVGMGQRTERKMMLLAKWFAMMDAEAPLNVQIKVEPKPEFWTKIAAYVVSPDQMARLPHRQLFAGEAKITEPSTSEKFADIARKLRELASVMRELRRMLGR